MWQHVVVGSRGAGAMLFGLLIAPLALLGVEQIDLGELPDATLDRVEGAEHPLRRVRTTRRVIGQRAGREPAPARTAARPGMRSR
jgi:hypothetical protein